MRREHGNFAVEIFLELRQEAGSGSNFPDQLWAFRENIRTWPLEIIAAQSPYLRTLPNAWSRFFSHSL
jgi:hypothetical protein